MIKITQKAIQMHQISQHLTDLVYITAKIYYSLRLLEDLISEVEYDTIKKFIMEV